jgi:MFS family permease
VTFTLLMSVVSAGSLVGALATARRRSIGMRTVSMSALVFGLGMAALSVAPNRTSAFLVAAFVGLGSISFMTASTAIVQLRAAPTMRGRVLALQSMVFLGSTPIGGPIVGVISQRYGARYSIALGGIATLAAGAFGLAKARTQRRSMVTPEVLEPAIAVQAAT